MKKVIIISLVVAILLVISLALIHHIQNKSQEGGSTFMLTSIRDTMTELPDKKVENQTLRSPQADNYSHNHPGNITPKNNPNSSQTNINSVPEQNSGIANQQKDDIESSWKKYINKQDGFAFKYPSIWSKKGEEPNTTNIRGDVMSTRMNFIDTASGTILLIEYHFAPYGKKLFKKTLSDYYSSQGIYANAKLLEVAGNQAIEASVIKDKDIKGNVYNPPLKEIFLIFLDKEQTGSVFFYFKTPLDDSDAEVSKFKKLISTFEFIN